MGGPSAPGQGFGRGMPGPPVPPQMIEQVCKNGGGRGRGGILVRAQGTWEVPMILEHILQSFTRHTHDAIT